MLGKFIQNVNYGMRRFYAAFAVVLYSVISLSSAAYAQDVSLIANNVVGSASNLPNLVAALCYLLGLVFGVRGILKLKGHVENPGESSGQVPLRTPMISFIVGGALFALPMLYNATENAINNGATGAFGASLASSLGALSILFGGLGFTSGIDVNTILNNIILSIRDLPGVITAIAYLLGIVIIVMGAIKTKEHVESPEQVKLHEPVIRLLTGGALLTMPTIYNAMFNSIDGSGGILTGISSIFGTTGFLTSSYINGTCTASTGSLGQLICSITSHTGAFPAFLTAISYVFGLVMGIWGVLKIRDHVLNPQQTTVFEGVSRFIAGGAFFALPAMIEVFKNTVTGGPLGTLFGVATVGATPYNYGQSTGVTTFQTIANNIMAGGTCPSGTGLGLDGILVCFAADILAPMHVVLNFFAFVAGIIFIMIGISRLVKGAQEGAKAPGGLGTLMTFAIGGALVSYNDLMRAVTTTFTGSATSTTYATMNYTTGMTGPEQAAAHAIITSIIQFMIVIGIISFVRGLFIVRGVAEGNQQSSMMAGVTHIIGGTLAVNLGAVINAVQATLGTTGYGITFT